MTAVSAHQPIPIGARFGQWTVIQCGIRDAYGNWNYLCQCACGTVRPVAAINLRGAKSGSCGCLNVVLNKVTDHPLYPIWQRIIQVCENPHSHKYPIYGGRGITVCDRWRSSFWSFVEDMGDRPHGMSIDRIDNDGNYEPGNCRWATPKQQQNNQRRTTVIEAFGVRKTLSEWADETGIKKCTIRCRIQKYGWNPEKALSKEPQLWWRR